MPLRIDQPADPLRAGNRLVLGLSIPETFLLRTDKVIE